MSLWLLFGWMLPDLIWHSLSPLTPEVSEAGNRIRPQAKPRQDFFNDTTINPWSAQPSKNSKVTTPKQIIFTLHIWSCLQIPIRAVIEWLWPSFRKTLGLLEGRLFYSSNSFLIQACFVIVLRPLMTSQPPGLQQPPRSEKPSAVEFTRPWRPSPWCTTWRPCTSPTVWRTRPRLSSTTKTHAGSTRRPAQMRSPHRHMFMFSNKKHQLIKETHVFQPRSREKL